MDKKTRMTIIFEHIGPDGEVLEEQRCGGILDVSGVDTAALAGIAANTVKSFFPLYMKGATSDPGTASPSSDG